MSFANLSAGVVRPRGHDYSLVRLAAFFSYEQSTMGHEARTIPTAL
jgi:hypothetical protein